MEEHEITHSTKLGGMSFEVQDKDHPRVHYRVDILTYGRKGYFDVYLEVCFRDLPSPNDAEGELSTTIIESHVTLHVGIKPNRFKKPLDEDGEPDWRFFPKSKEDYRLFALDAIDTYKDEASKGVHGVLGPSEIANAVFYGIVKGQPEGTDRGVDICLKNKRLGLF